MFSIINMDNKTNELVFTSSNVRTVIVGRSYEAISEELSLK